MTVYSLPISINEIGFLPFEDLVQDWTLSPSGGPLALVLSVYLNTTVTLRAQVLLPGQSCHQGEQTTHASPFQLCPSYNSVNYFNLLA